MWLPRSPLETAERRVAAPVVAWGMLWVASSCVGGVKQPARPYPTPRPLAPVASARNPCPGSQASSPPDAGAEPDALSASHAEPEASPFHTPPTESPPFVRDVWQKLAQSAHGCPKDFDYFPDGGMRNFACHLKSLISYQELGALSGLRVFLSGPHSRHRLVLTSRKSFGHYNPEFVRWAVDHLVPGSHDSAFRGASQDTYDRYVKPLASAFFATYRKIEREPECFERERRRYQALLDQGAVPEGFYERYHYFMDQQFCRAQDPPGFMGSAQARSSGGYNGNVVNTCVAFWIRRSIDGTMPEFYRGLAKLIHAYDPELYRSGGS